MKLSIILFGLYLKLRYTAWRYPLFRERLKEHNFTAQIKNNLEDLEKNEINEKIEMEYWKVFIFLFFYFFISSSGLSQLILPFGCPLLHRILMINMLQTLTWHNQTFSAWETV